MFISTYISFRLLDLCFVFPHTPCQTADWRTETKTHISRPTMPLTCLLTVSIPHGREEDSVRQLLALLLWMMKRRQEESERMGSVGFSSGRGVAVIFLILLQALRISYSSFFIISSTSRCPLEYGGAKKAVGC